MLYSSVENLATISLKWKAVGWIDDIKPEFPAGRNLGRRMNFGKKKKLDDVHNMDDDPDYNFTGSFLKFITPKK